MTIFEKIASGEIPAKLIHETEDFVAFHDVNPQAPVHVLIIPRKCIPRVALAAAAHADLLGRMLLASREIAEKLGVLESGYRLDILKMYAALALLSVAGIAIYTALARVS